MFVSVSVFHSLKIEGKLRSGLVMGCGKKKERENLVEKKCCEREERESNDTR